MFEKRIAWFFPPAQRKLAFEAACDTIVFLQEQALGEEKPQGREGFSSLSSNKGNVGSKFKRKCGTKREQNCALNLVQIPLRVPVSWYLPRIWSTWSMELDSQHWISNWLIPTVAKGCDISTILGFVVVKQRLNQSIRLFLELCFGQVVLISEHWQVPGTKTEERDLIAQEHCRLGGRIAGNRVGLLLQDHMIPRDLRVLGWSANTVIGLNYLL